MAAQDSRLTDHDRDLIARARKLAVARDIREHTGEADNGMAYAVALGEAKHLLAELAGRLEQLGS
jgi:hypothetical protein